MKKRYTKKQIVEAIKYWESILKRMDESKSRFLDICSSKFGEDIVFSDTYSFEYTDQNVNETFKLLDNRIFESKLSHLNCLKIYIGNAIEEFKPTDQVRLLIFLRFAWLLFKFPQPRYLSDKYRKYQATCKEVKQQLEDIQMQLAQTKLGYDGRKLKEFLPNIKIYIYKTIIIDLIKKLLI